MDPKAWKTHWGRLFKDRNYKSSRNIMATVDRIIEKMGNCQSIEELNDVLSSLPMGNKEFLDKVTFKPEEIFDEKRVVIIADATTRNLKFKVLCMLTISAFLPHRVTYSDMLNLKYRMGERLDHFYLPEEVQCAKYVDKIIDILMESRQERDYKKLEKVSDKYQSLVLSNIKILANSLKNLTFIKKESKRHKTIEEVKLWNKIQIGCINNIHGFIQDYLKKLAELWRNKNYMWLFLWSLLFIVILVVLYFMFKTLLRPIIREIMETFPFIKNLSVEILSTLRKLRVML